MNKPKKRKIYTQLGSGTYDLRDSKEDLGYNFAYDEWEKFLPSEGEIEKILGNKITHKLGCEFLAEISEYCTCDIRGRRKDLAKKIAKRIGKEKTNDKRL